MLQEGEHAPAWKGIDEKGSARSSDEFSGRWYLLYFYPMDETPGCTTEACALRDAYEEYAKRGITILGVSADSSESHAAFIANHQLPFSLIADTKKEIIEAYGAGGVMTKRVSYLIDAEGVVRKTYPSVDPAVHAMEIVHDFDVLAGS